MSGLAGLAATVSPSSSSPHGGGKASLFAAAQAVGKAATISNIMRSPSNRGEPLGPPREDLSKCGVGLYFELQDQDSHPVIKEVTARGSAEREGSIQAGDKILAVDDESVEGKLLHQVEWTPFGCAEQGVMTGGAEVGDRERRQKDMRDTGREGGSI